MTRIERLSDDVTLYLGDCLEIMATLGTVNHVISDPPYEDELHAAVGKIRRKDGREMISELGFAGVNADRSEIARLCVGASTGWVILFTLAEGVRSWRDELQAAKAKYDTCLFWIKPDASPRFNGQGAARGAECAVTAWAGTGSRSWSGGGKRGVYTHCVNTKRDGRHPTEKPVPLMCDLIEDYTNEGQTVLDPFMGSGTTGIACIRYGRKFIGIEKDPVHFETALDRLKNELSRPRLNLGAPASVERQEALL